MERNEYFSGDSGESGTAYQEYQGEFISHAAQSKKRYTAKSNVIDSSDNDSKEDGKSATGLFAEASRNALAASQASTRGRVESDPEKKGNFFSSLSFSTKVSLYYGNDPFPEHTENILLSGDGESDVITSSDIADYVLGGGRKNILYGVGGNDILNGGSKRDTLYGQDGEDILYGGGGNDRLYGGSGKDILFGGAGNDLLYGGFGDDIIYADGGSDRIHGGLGFDIAVAYGAASDFSLGRDGTRYILTNLVTGERTSLEAIEQVRLNASDGALLYDLTQPDNQGGPQVTSPISKQISEDSGVFTFDLLEFANGQNPGDVLTIKNVIGLPQGFVLNGTSLVVDSSIGIIEALGTGEKKAFILKYIIVDQNGKSVNQTATINVDGVNDTPTVSGPLSAQLLEDDPVTTIDLLSGLADADIHDTHSITLTSALPAGISLVGTQLAVDPSDVSFQYLGQGSSVAFTIDYLVSDSAGGQVAQQLQLTVTGRNDAPSVAAPLIVTATEAQPSLVVDLLQGLSDVDVGDSHGIANVSGLVSGLSLNGTKLTVDPSNPAFAGLAFGESQTLNLGFDIVDSSGAIVAQTLSVTINGIDNSGGNSPNIPSIISFSPDTGILGDHLTSNGTLVLSGQSDPGSTVELFRDSVSVGTALADINGQWSLSLPDQTSEGSHSFTAIASAGGLSSNQSSAFNITVDLTAPAAPQFDLASPDIFGLPQNHETQASRVTLVGVTDPGAIVELAATGVKTVAANDGTFRFVDVDLALGNNAVTVNTYDAAANSSASTLDIVRSQSTTSSNSVLDWNAITLNSIKADASAPTYASRALAMESLAVYDTLNAISGTSGYLVSFKAPVGASADAAVAAAAHSILSYLYPTQKPALDTQFTAALGAITDGIAENDGVAIGEAVAGQIIALRASDGWNDFETASGSTALGQWRPEAPMYMQAQDPQWAALQTFALTSPDQFRAVAPPDMSTQAYANSLNQVMSLGSATSSTRTAQQTQIARFWADGGGTFTPPGHWNQIAADAAKATGGSLSADARLFAQLNVALADAGIAAWDTKYTYSSWRPITAIQNGNAIGNSAITGDPNWQPLLLTPNHPEYVSGHSTYSAAAAEILNATFGTNYAFSTGSQSLPGVVRSFANFDAAVTEAGESRIFGGIHFDFSNTAGQALGRQVGQWALQSFNLSQDTQAPHIFFAQQTGIVVASAFDITGSVSDSLSGVASLTVSIDGGAASSVTIDPNGAFTLPASLPLDGTAEGSHSYAFTAIDAAGNSATQSFDLTLDTLAPAISLATGSISDGDVIGAGARLVGAADPTGTPLTALNYRIDGGQSYAMSFNNVTGAFDTLLDLSALSTGAHSIVVTATDAGGNISNQTLVVSLGALTPFVLTSATPSGGAGDVGVTFRPEIFFSRAVDATTLTSQSFYATDAAGNKLAATIIVNDDFKGAMLSFGQAMPGASNITLHVEGDKIAALADGTALDADADGSAGGALISSFTTVSTTPVPGTTITGKVLDPGADLKPMTFDDVRAGPDQILHTADDVYLNPLAGVKLYILGRENDYVVTDQFGNFTLTNVPSGNVKLAVDGRTSTNAPSGFFFPEMVMDLQVKAGQVNTVMGGMGTAAEQAANANDPAVYLPRIQSNILQSVNTTGDTIITAVDGSGGSLTDAQLHQMSLKVAAGSLVDANGNAVQNAQVGISAVPPELVQDMLPAGVLQHTFDITIQTPGAAALTTPAELTMPNVFGLAPGEKTYLLSFDHTTGRLVIDGTMTVNADGLSVTTDPGQGVTKPGWHGMTPPGNQLRTGPVRDPGPDPFDDCGPVDMGLTVAGIALSATAFLTLSGPATLGALAAGIAVGAAQVALDLRNGHVSDAQWDAATTVWGTYTGYSGYRYDVQTKQATAVLFSKEGQLGEKLIIQELFNISKLKGIFGIADKALGIFGIFSGVKDIYDCLNGNSPSNSLSKMSANISNNSFNDIIYNELININTNISSDISSFISQYISSNVDLSHDFYLKFDNGNLILLNEDGSTYRDTLNPNGFSRSIKQIITDINDPIAMSNVMDSISTNLNKIQVLMNDIDTNTVQIDSDINSVINSFYSYIDQISQTVIPNSGFYEIVNIVNGNIISRGVTDNNGYIQSFVPSDVDLEIRYFDPSSMRYGAAIAVSGMSGSGLSLSSKAGLPQSIADLGIITEAITNSPQYPDTDGDGLPDIAEEVIGSNPNKVDSIVTGISDYDAILNGIDATTVSKTGVISSLTLQGQSQAITLSGSLTDSTKQYAFVATGSYGLAIVDASSPFKPVVLSELALSGFASDVAVSMELNRAVVADGTSGAQIIDFSNPASPKVVASIPGNATQVEVIDSYAYASDGTSLVAIDLATNSVSQTLSMGGSTIASMAHDGSLLYVMDTARKLHVIDTSLGVMSEIGSLTVSSGQNGEIFAADDIVYVGNDTGFQAGYLTVDVSDPKHPALISGPDAANIAGRAIALNGSGLGVMVGNPGGVFGTNVLDVVNTSDPTKTDQFITRYTLPQSPLDVAIGSGIAFVADGSAGLQVVNYRSFDTNGVAPTITNVILPNDPDLSTAAIEVEEGKAIKLAATIGDDVQVRNIDVLVNGVVARNDVSYPWDLRAAMPTIAANGSTSVTVQIRATDTGGNVSLSAPMFFELTPDATPPVLLSQSLSDGSIRSQQTLQTIVLRFNEAIDPASLNGSSFTLLDSGGNSVPLTFTQLDNGKTAVIGFSQLALGDYKFVVDRSLVTDLTGNILGSGQTQADFTVRLFTAAWAMDQSGNWFTASNWDVGHAPSANDDVLIDTTAPTRVTYSGNGQIDRLTLNGTGVLSLNSGTLNVGSQIIVAAPLVLSGATIKGGIIDDAGGLMRFNSGTLDGVEYHGTLDVRDESGNYGNLTIRNGLQLFAADGVSPGSLTSSGTYYSQIFFAGTQTFDNATITLGNVSGYYDYFYIQGDYNATIGQYVGALTLGPNAVIDQQGYAQISNYFGTEMLTNQGSIIVDAQDMSFYIAGVDLVNEGSIAISNGADLYFQSGSFSNTVVGVVTIDGATSLGMFNIKQGGAFSNQGIITLLNGANLSISGNPSQVSLGSISLDAASSLSLGVNTSTSTLNTLNVGGGTLKLIGGVLDNSNSVFSVGALGVFNTVNLGGGTIRGGIIDDASGGMRFNGGVLDGVEYHGTLDVRDENGNYGSLTIRNGITLRDADGISPGLMTLSGAYYNQVRFEGTQTFDNATIKLGDLSGYTDTLYIQGIYNSATNQYEGALTLGAQAVFDQEGYAQISNYFGTETLTNQGTIIADAQDMPFYISGVDLVNEGSIAVSNGADLYFSNGNFINSANGSLSVDGVGSSATFIYAQGATASNLGSISVTNGGTLTVAGIATGTATGAFTVDATSTLNLGIVAVTSALEIVTGGGTLNLIGGGLLINAGDVFDIGLGGSFGTINLNGGLVIGGTINDQNGSMQFSGGELHGVEYHGVMNVRGANGGSGDIKIVNGLTLLGADGISPGVMDLSSTGYSQVTFQGTQSFDNATIKLGNATGATGSLYAAGNYDSASGQYVGTLTLDSNLVIDQEGYSVIAGYYGNETIISKGSILVNAQDMSMVVSPSTFINDGSIAVSNGADLYIQSAAFSNAAGMLTVDGAGSTVTVTQGGDVGSMMVANGASLSLMNVKEVADSGAIDIVEDGFLNIANSDIYTDIIFNGVNAADITLDAFSNLYGTISGWDVGDTVHMTGFDVVASSFSGNSIDLIASNGQTKSIVLSGTYDPTKFGFISDNAGGAYLYYETLL